MNAYPAFKPYTPRADAIAGASRDEVVAAMRAMEVELYARYDFSWRKIQDGRKARAAGFEEGRAHEAELWMVDA